MCSYLSKGVIVLNEVQRAKRTAKFNNRVVTKKCNKTSIIGIAYIKMNHNSSTALERSVINYWEGLIWFNGYPTSPSAFEVV